METSGLGNLFTLPFPYQLPAKALGLDARPSRMKQWGNALNLANLGESTRAILERLQLTNRAVLEPAVRFEWLESLALPLQTIAAGLKKHYQHKPFPLSPKGLAVARLANTLHGEMMVGYRLLLAGTPDASMLGRRSDRQRRIVACYRLFLHAGEALCNQRLMYLPPPAGMWRHLHHYFAQIVGHGWEREEIVPAEGGAPVTIEKQYKRMLILSQVPAPMFPAKELAQLGQHLNEWSSRVTLERATQHQTDRLRYCVRFELDAPLAAVTERCCGACDSKVSGLLLDMAPLTELLERHGEEQQLSPESRRILLRSWRIPAGPRELRNKVDLPLRLVVGLRNIHRLLTPPPSGEEGIVADPAAPSITIPDFDLVAGGGVSLPSTAHTDQFLAQRDAAADIWESVYVGREIPPPVSLWNDESPAAPITQLEARALDSSSSGYRVELELPEKHDFRLGEVAAFSEQGEGEWHLALLRWVRPLEGRRAALGLERIGEKPCAIEVKVSADRGAPPATLHGLTSFDRDMRRVLLLPLLPSLASKRLAIIGDGAETAISLKENLALSPDFECYRYTSDAGGAGVAVKAAHTRPALADRSDDPFGDIWSSL